MESKTDVFLDTSFFYALISKNDDFHTNALGIVKFIEEDQLPLVTSNFILDETLTLIRVRLGYPYAIAFQRKLSDFGLQYKTIRVLAKDERAAWEWFQEDWSKLSFTDCTSFAVMKRLGLTKVATFDDHYQKAGFDIIS